MHIVLIVVGMLIGLLGLSGYFLGRAGECVYFMSEVDTRNRYATFEAVFSQQNWYNRCMNRLSRTRESKRSSDLTGRVS
ncbi:hypothetical protein HMPREF3214_00411 [Alloscardovia omnicolens]|nr:hypothetical protein HMPREF3214_00411 [Alloscardovia omnicolens]